MKPYVLEVTRSARERLENVFNFDFISSMLEQHFQGRQDHTRRIFCLVSFFVWHEIYRPELRETDADKKLD